MRPTFFGCFPTQTPPEYPIVVYFPNSPPLNGHGPVAKYAVLILLFTRLVSLISLSFPAPMTSNLIIPQNIPSYF